MDHAETIVEAKRIAESIMISQVGDVNAMASAETLNQLTNSLLSDGVLLYQTIRTIAGVAVAFATAKAAETTKRGTAEFDAKSIWWIRGAVANLTTWVDE